MDFSGSCKGSYIPGIVLAFVWGLYNPYHLLKESEKSIDHVFILIGIVMIISSRGNDSK